MKFYKVTNVRENVTYVGGSAQEVLDSLIAHRVAFTDRDGKRLHVLTTWIEKPWEHYGHREVQHRDGSVAWCERCGWAAPRPSLPAVQIKIVTD